MERVEIRVLAGGETYGSCDFQGIEFSAKNGELRGPAHLADE